MVMEYEPVPKRRRTASPTLLQDANTNIQPPARLNIEKPAEGEDDKAYQQYLERAFADPRFRTTLAQIFDKYDRKSAQPNEAIDPALCGISAENETLVETAIDAQLNGLVDNGALPYHLDTNQDKPKDDNVDTVDYQMDRSNETPGVFGSGGPVCMPGFPGGAHSGFMQSWYGNPFQGPGSYTSPWDGFSGPVPMSHDPSANNGPWMAPGNFAYNPASWPAHVPQQTQNALPPQSAAAQEPAHIAQAETFNVPRMKEEALVMAQEDESTDNCQFELHYDALGRKKRRRTTQPRFSKNGKRLGRPPKSEEAPKTEEVPKIAVDAAAYDGEGEDNGGPTELKNVVREFGDDDDDTLWGELAEALQLASKATSNKGNRDSAKQPPKGENFATESDGAVEADKDAGQAETMLRKIQQELIDRAVRRSTMSEEHCDDTDAGAEGRRRSGRERKPVNFGAQVSWDKVSAERRVSHKIKMHLRDLSVRARRERKKKEKEEAEKAAKEKEEAEKAAQEKRKAEELAAAARGEQAKENPTGDIPSTIPDSQDSVTTLPIRTTPKKPQSTQIMRQTMKNHVNSVVHFEEDDEDLSDEEVPAAFSIKNPVFSYKKPQKQVNSFLGENFIDTVYALSDDEAPALLDSLKRVSIGGKKKPALVPVALAPRRETTTAQRNTAKGTRQIDAEATKCPSSGERASSTPVEENTSSDITVDPAEAAEAHPEKPTEQDHAVRSSMPNGADGNDSGIDIPSEQASSEQAERDPEGSASVPEKPLFQDPDLLGAADILDSLDMMSETEDIPSSPVGGRRNLENEDMQTNDLILPATNSAPVSSRKNTESLSVDAEPMHESMDIFEDVAGDLPFMDETETEDDDCATTLPAKAPKKNPMDEKIVEKEPTHKLPPASEAPPLTNLKFVVEKFEESEGETGEDAQPTQLSKVTSSSPPLRHPLPQQNKGKRAERGYSFSSTVKSSTPKATSKEPSPSNFGDRPRLPSSNSSRTPAPEAQASRSSSVKKSSSSSRRSLLSLISGGEEDIESLVRRKHTTQTPKPAQSTSPAPSSSSSRKPSSSSHRKSKPSSSSSSSLTRLSLGPLSSVSRDRHKSSKERQEAKERRRKSSGATTNTAAVPSEKKGTCGIDGYTCGRDFCFTCL